MKKEIPGWVKLIAWLFYFGSFIGLVVGLVGLVGALLLGGSTQLFIPALGYVSASLLTIGYLALMGLGVLIFFVGRDLYRTRNWARIVAIIVTCSRAIIDIALMIYSGTFAIFTVVDLAIALSIAGYLMFNKEVKKIFK